jgi:outer membrane protein TolC
MDMGAEAPGMAAAGSVRLPAIPTGISLDQLESIALHSNPTLVQARAQVDASMSRAFQAGLFPNPVAGYVSE